MNLYIHTISKVIDYIEQNISEHLTLQGVSQQFCLSEFHFSRIFKTITGVSLKQYILGRKLTLALHKLKHSQTIVIIIMTLAVFLPGGMHDLITMAIWQICERPL